MSKAYMHFDSEWIQQACSGATTVRELADNKIAHFVNHLVHFLLISWCGKGIS